MFSLVNCTSFFVNWNALCLCLQLGRVCTYWFKLVFSWCFCWLCWGIRSYGIPSFVFPSVCLFPASFPMWSLDFCLFSLRAAVEVVQIFLSMARLVSLALCEGRFIETPRSLLCSGSWRFLSFQFVSSWCVAAVWLAISLGQIRSVVTQTIPAHEVWVVISCAKVLFRVPQFVLPHASVVTD